MLSLGTLRNMILLTLNLRRQAGVWPKVFHPLEAERWPTKEANAFMNKHITLVPEQRKDLESDLTQESFLKDFEKSPSYKASFEFKTKMFASMKSQRTSLVPLFRLTDSVTQVNSMWMKLWTLVGLLSFQRVILKQVTLAQERRMSPQFSNLCWLLPRCHFGRKRID